MDQHAPPQICSTNIAEWGNRKKSSLQTAENGREESILTQVLHKERISTAGKGPDPLYSEVLLFKKGN